MSEQFVGRDYLTLFHAASENTCCGQDGCRGGEFDREVPDYAEPESDIVVSFRVGSNDVPATTFVDSSISTDEETVANVVPMSAIHVEVLDAPHLLDATAQITAFPRIVRMMDEGHVDRMADVGGRSFRWSSTPLLARYKRQLIARRCIVFRHLVCPGQHSHQKRPNANHFTV